MTDEIVQKRRWMKWVVVFVCWSAFGLFFASQGYINQAYAGRPVEWSRLLKIWLSDSYLWAILSPLIISLAKRFPIERRRWLKAVLGHLLLSLLFSLLAVLGFIMLRPLMGLPPIKATLPQSFLALLVLDFHWDLMKYWSLIGIAHALDYYRKYREREREAAQLEVRAAHLQTQLAEAQLSALRMQLHPHFLFNTLNAIVVLVRKSSNEEAIQMLTGLSELLRHALENIGAQEVRLKQEIEFLELYLEIEQVRFNDRLRIRMQIQPDTLDALVPNLILQPLVENALRHGIGKRATAGLLEISARREDGILRLQVRDDGPGLPASWPVQPNNGIGIANTRTRLRQMYGDDRAFEIQAAEGGGALVTLRIPFHLQREETRERV